MKDSILTIISNDKIADKTYEMKLGFPADLLGIRINPGQFINIKIKGFFLRRPISICDWTDSTLTIIYKIVGRGTEALARAEAGNILDVLLPLGNGYDISGTGESPVAIGGGAGVPPMYGLCLKLKEMDKAPVAIIGFNTKREVFYEDKFRQAGIKTLVVTADGSYGEKGFVTDVLSRFEASEYFACGPEAMLRAVDNSTPEDIPAQFSFEERMGCGFGACMGCSCETKYGSKRICREGPVLRRDEIIW